ncbi:porin [Spiribacter sp. C176]|uniref:Porin n=1 Tax=Spiribacter salilacus TaxID=2664894 RepID=A0A6N7QTD6_9GAMM|nr:porin [Spiribacter salilacus]MRH78850.1 porin [Spiribacter salilacus]
MKKVYLAAAATSALALAATPVMADDHASMSVYGWITAEVQDNGTEWDATGNGNSPSRFGIRGSREFGAVTGDAQLEYGVTKAQGEGPGIRLANAALSGDFGSVRIGSQWNPGYLWTTATTDVFTSGAYTGARSTDFVFRQDGAIFYYAPSLGGLDIAVGGNMLASDDSSDEFDTMTVSARYSFGDLYVSATYMEADDENSSEATAFAASYDFGMFTLAGSMSDNDGVGSYNDNGTPYEVVATVSATEELTLKAAYTDRDLEAGDDSSMAAEAAYAFGSGVTGFAGFSSSDDGINDGEDILSFGVQVVF